LPVSFDNDSGPATLSGSTLTITGAGMVTVRASQSGDASWNPAVPVDRSFAVAPAQLTVRADDKTRAYGAANPLLTATFSGFVNGDNSGSLNGSPSLSTTATASSPVAGGPYPITVTQGTLSAANYSFNFVTGSLTVTRATLTVNADDKSRVYGAPNPPLTASYSGFVNGESTDVLSGSPSLSTTATPSSSVAGSPYTITVTQGTLTAGNYSFNFVSGFLTVTKATLTVTADNKS